MNWDRIEGNWKEFKGKAQQQWGKVTNDDLDVLKGSREELEGVIQKRYGYAKDKARDEIDTWLKNAGVPLQTSKESQMYSAKEYDQALLTPESIFTDPMDVVETDSLTPEQKMTVLKRWEANSKDLEVASSESMTGGQRSRLDDVGAAIAELMKNETVDENSVVQVQASPSAGAPAP